ncbi:hypothetical protein RJ641_005799, partial [Dillenia turbinata]
MRNNGWIFFMNGDTGSPYLLPSDPLLLNGFGLLAQIHPLVDSSINTFRHTSLSLREAFRCISKFASSSFFGFSARSALNAARKFPDASIQSSCKISTQINKDIASFGHTLMEYYFNYNYTTQHMFKYAAKLQKFPVLALAAAMVPPFNNMSPNVLAVPLEQANVKLHGSMDQCPCNVDNRGCAGLPLPELTSVEPGTGIEFPRVLDNILVGQDNPNSTSEVVVGTEFRSMKIIKIKSLKVYAFGFYIHPYSVCQRLGPKYGSIQDNELNEHPDFYADLLRYLISLYVFFLTKCRKKN